MRVIFAPAARRDIARIRAYITPYNPPAAKRMAQRLQAAAESLNAHPYRGREGMEPGTRELVVVRPYIIVYRVHSDGVEITRVFHGAQDRRKTSTDA